MTDFYDAVTPANIPARAHAVLYADGLYAAGPEEAKRFSAVRWNTIEGGAAAAAHAGACDYERLNPVHDEPGRLREWAVARRAMNCRARVYCDMSDAASAWVQVHDLPGAVFWIATLDNRKWSAEELAADLEQNFRAPIPAGRIWANQYAGGPTAPFDTSVLLGVW